MELIKDHLPEFNKTFVEEYTRIIATAYQKDPKQAYEFAQNFYRIPGMPIGFFIATDGIVLLSPEYQNNQLKIVYNTISFDMISQMFKFDQFLKDHQIDLALLTVKDCDQDVNWAENEYRLVNQIQILVVQLALITFYESQGLDQAAAQKEVEKQFDMYQKKGN